MRQWFSVALEAIGWRFKLCDLEPHLTTLTENKTFKYLLPLKLSITNFSKKQFASYTKLFSEEKKKQLVKSYQYLVVINFSRSSAENIFACGMIENLPQIVVSKAVS